MAKAQPMKCSFCHRKVSDQVRRRYAHTNEVGSRPGANFWETRRAQRYRPTCNTKACKDMAVQYAASASATARLNRKGVKDPAACCICKSPCRGDRVFCSPECAIPFARSALRSGFSFEVAR